MSQAEKYAKWIVDNPDKKGSPEFETVANAYKLAKSESVDSDIPQRDIVSPKKKKLTERAKEVAEQSAIGGVVGAFTPEIMTGLGGAAAAFPLTAPAAPWLLGAGQAARGARLAGAGLGALGGATGETAGQAAEMMGASRPTAEAARFVGGIVGPEFANSVKSIVSFTARKLGGLGAEGAVRSVMKDLNITDKEITPSQKEFIRKQVEALRGGAASDVPQKSIYDIMATGAADITSEAEKRALAARQKGISEKSEAERIARKMGESVPRLEQAAQNVITNAQNQRSNIAVERENSDIGQDIRKKIFDLFSSGMTKRSEAYKAQQEIRDNIVSEKESKGEFVQQLPEYKSLLTDLKNKLLIGRTAQEQKTAPVTEKGVLQAYQNIYDAISSRRVATAFDEQTGKPTAFKTFPTSFQALDDVRRKLGDVAFGKDVEGYSAIGSNIAKKYYKEISELQSKFAGEAHDKLQSDYELASSFLEKFRSKAGQKATAIDRFDPSRYAYDPASLTKDYFKTKQSVKDLIELSGNDLGFVVKSASEHASRELKNLNSKQAKAWSDKNSDWLTALPDVNAKVNSYIKTLESAETEANKILTASKKLPAREKEALRTGEAAVTTAEKEASRITEEASKKVKEILGDKFPAQRVKDLILSGSKSQWDQIIPILEKSDQGKKALGDAVQQVMASRAETGIRTASEFFRDNVRPALESSNLLPKGQLDNIQSTLEAIKNATVPEAQKMTLMQRLLRNSITGYLLPGAARLEKSKDDVINKKGSMTSVLPRFGASNAVSQR